MSQDDELDVHARTYLAPIRIDQQETLDVMRQVKDEL
jgi:hypothetical protein